MATSATIIISKKQKLFDGNKNNNDNKNNNSNDNDNTKNIRWQQRQQQNRCKTFGLCAKKNNL